MEDELLSKAYLLINTSKFPADIERAVEILDRAVDDPNALVELGNLFHEGKKVTKNLRRAYKYYKRSAKLGNGFAIYKVGFCYLNGLGTKCQAEKAVTWYKAALKHGVALAKNDLGYCLETGYGIEQDTTSAYQFYYEAMEQGAPHGAYNVARCLSAGIGIPRNREKSFEIYQRAVRMGNRPRALIGLAECYDSGLGTEKNLKSAFFYFLEAAKQGDADAEYQVAERYTEGKGVAENKLEAYKWYKKSFFASFLCAGPKISSSPGMKAKFLAEDWPRTHPGLDLSLQLNLLEFLLCSKEIGFVAELVLLIVSKMIEVCPSHEKQIASYDAANGVIVFRSQEEDAIKQDTPMPDEPEPAPMDYSDSEDT